MKHQTLKIEKVLDADVTWGDYGASRPSPGDWSNKIPATYRVTGPTGSVYSVSGTPSGWMQRPNWYYECGKYESRNETSKGGFATMAKCLEAIAKLEQAALAATN